MHSSRITKTFLARRRARARRRSAGAVIFIVATTLGLLAVMGVYALSATTEDLRAAGNVQRGVQANAASRYGATAIAEYINYNNADDIINRRMLNPNASLTSSDRNCRTTQKNDAALFGDSRTKSCVVVTQPELAVPYVGREVFTSQSFTHSPTATQTIDGDLYIEITNPTDAAPPPGYNDSSNFKFKMVTITSFGITKPRGTLQAETVRVGRGRFIVGPLRQ